MSGSATSRFGISANPRRTGFLGGFLLAQIALPYPDMFPCCYLEERDTSDRNRLAQWIKRHKPDAILTEWNEIGKLVESLEIRVPEDIGVAVLNTLDCDIKAGSIKIRN